MAAATIDEYLAGVPDDKRAALERLREQIHAAVPDAIEAISYGLPTFKLDGRWFVAFGVAKKYCSFYAGGAPLEALADELAGYRLWKGTINYPPIDRSPPSSSRSSSGCASRSIEPAEQRALGLPASTHPAYATGSRTNTGIWRFVLVWYFA